MAQLAQLSHPTAESPEQADDEKGQGLVGSFHLKMSVALVFVVGWGVALSLHDSKQIPSWPILSVLLIDINQPLPVFYSPYHWGRGAYCSSLNQASALINETARSGSFPKAHTSCHDAGNPSKTPFAAGRAGVPQSRLQAEFSVHMTSQWADTGTRGKDVPSVARSEMVVCCVG